MSQRGSFDDVLDAAIDALRRGEPVSRILADHPEDADALRPLLQAVAEIQSVPPPPEAGDRLADNFSTVRATLRQARAAQAQPGAARTAAQPRSWWQRRLSFASLSVPVGAVAALLLVGGAAAAAGAISQAPDLPGGIVHAVTFGHAGGADPPPRGDAATAAAGAKTPPHATATGHGDRTAASGSQASTSLAGHGATPGIETGTAAVESGTPGVTPPAPGGASGGLPTPTTVAGTPAPTTTPATPVAPVPGTRTGVISRVNGNTFTLTSADGDWRVNIDANTVVDGTIVEGATATVTGDLTADKNLHATRVDVTPPGAAPPGATATPSPGGSVPGPPPGGPPGLTRTPGSRGNGP